MDPLRLLRLLWHNTDTDTEVEQVAVTPGEKTAAPSDVVLGHGIHVTVEEMPEPSEAPSEPSVVAPETLPPPEDIEDSGQPTR